MPATLGICPACHAALPPESAVIVPLRSFCPNCGHHIDHQTTTSGEWDTAPATPGPRPAPADDPLIGRVLRQYRVLRRLGGGGMGVVYLAEDERLDRRVALKVMKPDLAADAEARSRFLREARAAAAVQHEHIVTIHEANEADGLAYLVMPYLEGESLEDRLRREAALPLPEVRRIGREVAEGLAAAHARGLVHRDVKPANIWLEHPAEPGAPARVRLLDFGLARPMGLSELSQPGALLGTPSYMSPEQARGADVDARSDLFSLGTLLYRMATGRLPFDGTNMMAVLHAIQHDEPSPPRTLRPDLPEALERLTVRLLAKDRDARPASARAVAQELVALAGSAPGRTDPYATVLHDTEAATASPAARPARRGIPPLAWIGAGVLALALLVVVAHALRPGPVAEVRAVPPPAPPPPARDTTPPALPPLRGYVDATVLRKTPAGTQKLALRDPGALPLRAGADFVQIEAALNRPAHLYLAWVDTEGNVDLVYPWDEEKKRRPPEEKPVEHLFWPTPTDGGFLPAGPAGTSTLLLLARETRLPDGADVAKLFGKLPPQKSLATQEAAWFENGAVVRAEGKFAPINFPPDRAGPTAQKTASFDDPVMQVQGLWQTALRQHFAYSRGVCFSTEPAR